MKRKNSDISIIPQIEIEDKNYYTKLETLFNCSDFISFYKKTQQSFSKSSLQEFIKEFRRKLEQTNKQYSFSFIKKTYSSLEQIQTMFIKIENFCKNNNIDLNIWEVFIKTKIKEYIDSEHNEICNLIQKDDINLLWLYTTLDKLFINEQLSAFVHFKDLTMKKLKTKKELEEFISKNLSWIEYLKYSCKIKDINENKVDSEIIKKSKSKISTNKLFTLTYYNKLNKIYKKQIFQKYFNKMIKYNIQSIRQFHRAYVDLTIKNVDDLTIYIKLINLDKV